VLRQLERIAAGSPNVRIFDPTPAFCDAAGCPPAREATLLFRDAHHLSREGALRALPAIRGDLDWLLEASRAGAPVSGR
jgi:hypothetical protein